MLATVFGQDILIRHVLVMYDFFQYIFFMTAINCLKSYLFKIPDISGVKLFYIC